MYYRLTLILLLLCFGAFGQTAVPDHTHFTIGQVMKVVYGDSTAGRNTSTLFSDSNAGYFDHAYGTKTMNPKTINGFRNYKYVVNSSISFSESGYGSSTLYIGGLYSLSVYAENGYNYIIATIYNASWGYIGQEYVSESGTLTTTLATGYHVQFYVDEISPVVYSDPINQYFIANDGHCTGGSCPPNYTWMAIYHMVDSGTFTGATKAEANAARDAYGQAQANAASCQCVFTGPPQ